MINRRFEAHESGKIWIVLAGSGVALYILWQVGSSMAAGSPRIALLIGAVFVALFIVGRIVSDWRIGVYYFLVWLLFEDLVRKYMGNNMTVYFTKDVLVAVTYGSFMVAQSRKGATHFHPSFKWGVGAFFILGLVQVFNPLTPSLFYGLLGLKLYFYYVPLMFVGYSLLQGEKDLTRFFVVNMGVAAVIASVGIMQAIVGLSFLNPSSGEDIEYLSHLTRITPSGVLVTRPPSVFVSDGRFGAYLLVVFILGLGATGFLLLRAKRGQVVVIPAVALVALAGMLTGSRGAFVYFLATAVFLAAGMLWGAPEGRVGGARLVKAIRRGFIFTAIALSLAVTIFPDVIGARLTFYQETLSPYSEDSELGARTWDYPVSEITKAMEDPNWLVGHGIGTASLGAQYVSRILGVPSSDVGVENGYGCIILEFGILGLILWFVWSVSLIWGAFLVALRVKGTWAFPVAISILWFAFLLLFPLTWATLNLYQNFVVNAYFWLLLGVLFRLPDLVNQQLNDEQVASVRTS